MSEEFIIFLRCGKFKFICHLELICKSWEKTMDCHSPGQGLMPASFKVRTILLDGDEDATEEALDPDFGEAAIGRVAPVDSGTVYNEINCSVFGYPACSHC
jgi:hypothetical protein